MNIQELNEKHKELGNWQKVAESLGISTKKQSMHRKHAGSE